MDTNNVKSQKPVVKQAAAFDPRAPQLTQPFKRLVEEGFIISMTVVFTPTGVTCSGKADDRLIAVDKSGLVKDKDYPVGMLAAVADKGNLIPLKGKNKTGKAEPAQVLPSKSLCKKDFEGSDAELLARAKAVAKACSGTTLVGRVRSAGAFDGTVTTSFQDWWDGAEPLKRAQPLIQSKYRTEISAADVARLGSVACPFRGTAMFTVVKGEDEEATPRVAPQAQKASGATSPKK